MYWLPAPCHKPLPIHTQNSATELARSGPYLFPKRLRALVVSILHGLDNEIG